MVSPHSAPAVSLFVLIARHPWQGKKRGEQMSTVKAANGASYLSQLNIFKTGVAEGSRVFQWKGLSDSPALRIT